MRRKNLKKGSSLAEMIIVIAVLSIISTIVISFVFMTGESVSTSRQKVDALNDIAIVESIIDSFITSELDNLNNLDSKVRLDITINKGTETNELSFDYDTKQLKALKDNTPTIYQTETVKDIEIIVKENTNAEKMVICFVTYELNITNNNKRSYTYSFCVYPYEYNNTSGLLGEE